MKFHLSLAPLAIVTIGLLGSALPSFASPSICDAVLGNIVANCGFELGTTSSTLDGNTNNGVPLDWTPNAGFDLEPDFNRVIAGFENSGNDSLSIGNYDYEPVPSLSQTLADTNGTTYAGSLYAYYGGGTGDDPGAFFMVLDGVTTLLTLNDLTSGQSWQQYTFSFTGTGSDLLTLEGNTNPSEWYIDDIVITAAGTSAVPEPRSAFLLAGILGAFLLLRRKFATQ